MEALDEEEGGPEAGAAPSAAAAAAKAAAAAVGEDRLPLHLLVPELSLFRGVVATVLRCPRAAAASTGSEAADAEAADFAVRDLALRIRIRGGEVLDRADKDRTTHVVVACAVRGQPRARARVRGCQCVFLLLRTGTPSTPEPRFALAPWWFCLSLRWFSLSLRQDPEARPTFEQVLAEASTSESGAETVRGPRKTAGVCRTVSRSRSWFLLPPQRRCRHAADQALASSTPRAAAGAPPPPRLPRILRGRRPRALCPWLLVRQ